MNEMGDNGAIGRFGRIEDKLDRVIEDLFEFRVDTATRLTKLETASTLSAKYDSERVSDRSYKWMKGGIIASFALGAVTLVARLFGL